jgi:hypothetical protein
MGLVLFIINAVGLIPTEGKYHLSDDVMTYLGPWYVYAIAATGFLIYISLIYVVIKEPVKEIQEIPKDEVEEVDRVVRVTIKSLNLNRS